MRVKLLSSLCGQSPQSGAAFGYGPGEVIDVSNADGKRMIEQGYAEKADAVETEMMEPRGRGQNRQRTTREGMAV